jgi:hypothetical protein
VALIIRSAAAGNAAAVAALIDAMGGHDGAAGNPAVDAVDHEALGWPGVRMLVLLPHRRPPLLPKGGIRGAAHGSDGRTVSMAGTGVGR